MHLIIVLHHALFITSSTFFLQKINVNLFKIWFYKIVWMIVIASSEMNIKYNFFGQVSGIGHLPTVHLDSPVLIVQMVYSSLSFSVYSFRLFVLFVIFYLLSLSANNEYSVPYSNRVILGFE